MGHDKLVNHYKSNFGLMQHHKWSLSDMESMMPWERYIYIELLQNYLIEEEKKAKQIELEQKTTMNYLNRRRM
jgi:hypothetical protein